MKNASVVTVKGYKNTSRTIRGLDKYKTYYFQIRTYSAFKKATIRSEWSKKKTVSRL